MQRKRKKHICILAYEGKMVPISIFLATFFLFFPLHFPPTHIQMTYSNTYKFLSKVCTNMLTECSVSAMKTKAIQKTTREQPQNFRMYCHEARFHWMQAAWKFSHQLCRSLAILRPLSKSFNSLNHNINGGKKPTRIEKVLFLFKIHQVLVYISSVRILFALLMVKKFCRYLPQG